MQQDKLNNETEKVQLDMDIRRKQRTFSQYERLYQERLVSGRNTCRLRKTTKYPGKNTASSTNG